MSNLFRTTMITLVAILLLSVVAGGVCVARKAASQFHQYEVALASNYEAR